ncbi:MAG: hypothetical protein WBL93_03575 [Lutisporaceae bacterium]
MPKINRIRIVNFSYNNNNRHIIDETFDFYGGENALLSLVNGGGKSVLVQIMLQPILPKISLQKREIKDFFIGKKAPSYIMIEWKLDDGAGYLLTGISITSKISHSTNEDEENLDIRYFTFLNAYEEANSFDIKHIPVTELVGRNIKIAAYNEFKKLLQKESDKNQHDLQVFNSTREEQNVYEKKLNTYSISRGEWKELMVKINEAEHGVSEVFTKCKTSKMVMEQWVIKYIEKVLNKSSDSDASDHKKLENMMSQVAWSLVDNENHIKEYQVIEDFNNDLKEIDVQIKSVLSHLDQEAQLKKKLGNGYHVLKMEEQRLKQEYKEIDGYIAQCMTELEGIDLEEKSAKIYQYQDEIDNISDELASLDLERIETNNQISKNIYQLNTQKAAERYQIIQDKERKIAELNQNLENATKNQEQLMKDLNKIKYSLKIEYEKILIGQTQKIAKLQSDEKNNKEQVETYIDVMKNQQIKLNQLNQSFGGINRDIESFEKEEVIVLQQLELNIHRNPLLKELDSKEIEDSNRALSQKVDKIVNSIENESNEIQKLTELINNQEKEINTINQKKVICHREQVSNQSKITDYEDDRDKVINVLKMHNISENNIFDNSYVSKTIQEKINSWSNKSFNLKMEVSEIEKLLCGVEQGVSYLPTSLITLLKEYNLPCYTGEQYLREIDEKKKNELLISNPLLPYALIVTEREYNQVWELLKNKELSQIVPVIRHGQQDINLENQQERIRFFSTSKTMSLNSKGVGAYIQQLKNQKEKKMLEQEETDVVMKSINQQYQIVKQFHWKKTEVDDIYEEEIRVLSVVCKLEEDFLMCQDYITTSKYSQDKLRKSIDILRAEYEVAIKKKEKFQEFLINNEMYRTNLQVSAELLNKIGRLNLEKEESGKAKEALDHEIKEIVITVLKERENKSLTEEKYDQVKDAIDDELITASITELEGKLESYKAKQNLEIRDLEEQIKSLHTDIKREQSQIKKMALNLCDYQNVLYSESLEIELEDESERLDKKKKLIDLQFNETNKSMSRIVWKKDEIEKTLGEMILISAEKIRGNYLERREVVNYQIDVKEKRKIQMYRTEIRLASLISKMEAEIKDIMYCKAQDILEFFDEIEPKIEPILNQFSSIKTNTNKQIDTFKKKNSVFNNKYQQTDVGTVIEAFKGIQIQIEALDRTYDKYFYLTERIDYYFIQLSQILKIMEQKMIQLQHSQKDLVEHAFLEAMRIYHEIPKISENSTVEIDGIKKRVLEIHYEEIQNELQAKEKMDIYINECLEGLKTSIKESEDENKVRRDLEKYMSTKELLNVISSLEHCIVKAYKVDINEKNRRMMTWEEIIVKNSGGEKFVAYFSLLVALISYSRKHIRSLDIFKKKEESKVLIMDNPFGPITSGHLLKPMFDIAEKYNTQLICLSDIKQGSVINSFDLVYMIKIRQNMMQEDFIELEPLILGDLKEDEKLEKAYLYTSVEQMRLFD